MTEALTLRDPGRAGAMLRGLPLGRYQWRLDMNDQAEIVSSHGDELARPGQSVAGAVA